MRYRRRVDGKGAADTGLEVEGPQPQRSSPNYVPGGGRGPSICGGIEPPPGHNDNFCDEDRVRRTRTLSHYLGVVQRLREATSRRAIEFCLANDLFVLAPYDRAFVFCVVRRQLVRVSGTEEIDARAAGMRWLRDLAIWLVDDDVHRTSNGCQSVWELELPERLQHGCAQLDGDIAVLPCLDRHRRPHVMVFLLRYGDRFSVAERRVLSDVASVAGQALSVVAPQPVSYRRVSALLAVVLVITVCSIVQIPMVISGSGKVDAIRRANVSVPYRARIQSVLVRRNDTVVAGQPLFILDVDEMRTRAAALAAGLMARETQVEQSAMRGIQEAEARSQLLSHRLDADVQRIELDALRRDIGRSVVRAPISGAVVLDRVGLVRGRSLSSGEVILSIRGGGDRELLFEILPADVHFIRVGDRVTFRAAGDFATQISASVSHLDYSPKSAGALRVSGVAEIPDGEAADLPVGSYGEVTVSGATRSVLYFLVRRPWVWLRSLAGW